MSRGTIDVDLFNPGQVFACIGLAELADVLIGGAEGAFAWDERGAKFTVGVPGAADPIAEACAFLAAAEVSSLAHHNSPLSTEKWSVPTRRLPPDAACSVPPPESPATLPTLLEVSDARGARRIVIDHWGDSGTRRDAVKFWAGSGGYPGAGLARDAIDLVREALRRPEPRPFEIAAPQSSSFRLDWRRDYIPIDIGFSLNNHAKMTTRGFPVVEVLAAIGLTHARPRRDRNLEYRYSVIAGVGDQLLSLALLRAALGLAALPFPTRRFRIDLGWPGQEGQARSITTVTEETLP